MLTRSCRWGGGSVFDLATVTMMAELERQAAYWLAVAELAQDEIHRRNP